MLSVGSPTLHGDSSSFSPLGSKKHSCLIFPSTKASDLASSGRGQTQEHPLAGSVSSILDPQGVCKPPKLNSINRRKFSGCMDRELNAGEARRGTV